MADQIEIHRATLGDLKEILALQKLAYQSEAQIYKDWSIPPLHQNIEELRDEFKTHFFLKAVRDDSIIGSVRTCTMENTCLIGRLIVHPDWQNRGIGTRLITEIEKFYPGVSRFELFTGSQSVKNLYLYRKLGYKDLKREPMSSHVDLIYLEKINRPSY